MITQVTVKHRIVANTLGHRFQIGDIVTLFREFSNGSFDAVNQDGDCSFVQLTDIINKKDMQAMKQAVIDTATRLCKAQNRVTTLEIKAEVIKTHTSYFWTQAFVSATMDDAHNDGDFTFVNDLTGTFRIYSLTNQPVVAPVTTIAIAKRPAVRVAATVVAPKTKSISKAKALELMENNRGHFFTSTTISKDGEIRIMNCQYLKDQTQSKLGYVRVKENILSKKLKNGAKDLKKSETGIRTINMQTLLELRIAGNSYKVK